MKIRLSYTLLACLLAISCLCQACARKAADTPAEIISQGSLETANSQDGPVYVGVRDSTGKFARLEAMVARHLRAKGYGLTSNPSGAAHIVHVTLLAAGQCDASTLRASIRTGYDSPCRLGNAGSGNGCVADVLLVRRNIPEGKKESHKRLRNISARNAIASSQIRIGLVVEKGMADHDRLADTLARELARAITGYSGSNPDPRAHP